MQQVNLVSLAQVITEKHKRITEVVQMMTLHRGE
jgi:hypothetical protein